jgi:hypothetical protein
VFLLFLINLQRRLRERRARHEVLIGDQLLARIASSWQ